MMLFAVAALLGVQDAGMEPRHTRMRAGNLIVIGRLENGAWEHADIPDDLLGHGTASATLRIKRVVRGHLPSRTLKVRYFAHTWLREDRSLRLTLRQGNDGVWMICAADGGEGFICR